MNFSNQTILNKTFKVGIYIRLSREDGDKLESESVSNQRDILQRYIKENNHILVDEYIDDGYSGTTFERPSFERMISDIENQKINMVITKDLSRLGRDYIKTGYYIENYFPENKVRYVAILDGVDTYLDTSNNDVTPFKAIINDMYAKDISKKIKGVLKEKELKGEFLGSYPPFGYKKCKTQKNKLEIDTNVAYIVKEIFELYSEGNGFQKISTILDKATKQGLKWALSNVISHKGQENVTLIEWAEQYNVYDIYSDYSKAVYNKKKTDEPTIEVLITNY